MWVSCARPTCEVYLYVTRKLVYNFMDGCRHMSGSLSQYMFRQGGEEESLERDEKGGMENRVSGGAWDQLSDILFKNVHKITLTRKMGKFTAQLVLLVKKWIVKVNVWFKVKICHYHFYSFHDFWWLLMKSPLSWSF